MAKSEEQRTPRLAVKKCPECNGRKGDRVPVPPGGVWIRVPEGAWRWEVCALCRGEGQIIYDKDEKEESNDIIEYP